MAESLRDQLSAAVEEHEQQQTESAPVTEGPGSVEVRQEAPTQTTAQAAETDQTKPGRTAGRARDEHGRLLPGPAKRPEANSAAEPGKAPPTSSSNQQAPQAAPAAEPKARPKYPTTWRKGLESHWESIAPEVLEEIMRREGNFASGVSTYKTEFEKAKPLLDAVAPYQEVLKQHGLDAAKQVGVLMGAHQRLALGSPQDKLAMFAQLARDYSVPLEGLFVRGQDGQVYLNQQLLQQVQQPRQQPQQDPRVVVQQILQEERAVQSIGEMERDTENYPHFQQVRQDMGRLLDSGLAQDLDSAYKAALRLPKYAELHDADQKLVREQEERAKREQEAARVAAARRNAVSPKSATPTGQGNASNAKGLRSHLEAAVNQHSGGGRV